MKSAPGELLKEHVRSQRSTSASEVMQAAKEDHQNITRAAYVVLGITVDGRKEIPGAWIGEHESGKFWLNVMNDLKSGGVKDVYLSTVCAE